MECWLSSLTTEVWLVFPPRDRTASSAFRSDLRTICRREEWQLQERVTDPQRTPQGNAVELLGARDVDAIYQRLHRAAVAVLYFGSPALIADAGHPHPLDRGKTISLFRFARYKAFVRSLNLRAADPFDWIEPFRGWCSQAHCVGDSDPRCLPFPTFDSRYSSDGLDDAHTRAEFERQHHRADAGSARCDARGLEWRTDPQAFHGHEQLHVAGHTLQRGFHWDVQNRTRRPIRLSTPTQCWEVIRYANVFPDGKVLGRPPNAKRK